MPIFASNISDKSKTIKKIGKKYLILFKKDHNCHKKHICKRNNT